MRGYSQSTYLTIRPTVRWSPHTAWRRARMTIVFIIMRVVWLCRCARLTDVTLEHVTSRRTVNEYAAGVRDGVRVKASTRRNDNRMAGPDGNDCSTANQ